MKSVMEAYNSFYLVLMALNGFSTDGNNLEIGSTRCSNLSPMIMLLLCPRKYKTAGSLLLFQLVYGLLLIEYF